MWLGILLTVTACAPLGIVSIVYASRVGSMWNAGDYAGARKASRDAFRWAMAGLAVTGVWCLFIFSWIQLAKSPTNPNPNFP